MNSELENTFNSEKKRTVRAITKRIKRIEKGILAKEAECHECMRSGEILHLADLLKTYFHLLKPSISSLTVPDYTNNNAPLTITLDPHLLPHEQLEAFYKKAKKLKKGLLPLQEAIIQLKNEKMRWNGYKNVALAISTFDELLLFQRQHALFQSERHEKVSTIQKEKPFHRFYSASGLTILVGKNAEANNELTFQYAHHDDMWLHAHRTPGSHVIIKKEKRETIDEEALLDAAMLAVYFSKARTHGDYCEVVYAPRNHVFRIKGAPKGKVSLSSYKTLRILISPERIRAIKERSKSSI